MRVRPALSVLGLVVALAGCGSSEPAPAPQEGALGRYERLEAARADVHAMLDRLGTDVNVREELLRDFDALVARDDVKRQLEEHGINAVTATVAGDGGLVVKVKRGHGLACFAGGRQAVAFDLSGWTAGATAGGERTHSVGVVCGLRREADFAQDYNFAVHGGAAGPKGSISGEGRAKSDGHVHYSVGTAVGFGGDVSAGQLTLSWAAPEADAGEGPK